MMTIYDETNKTIYISNMLMTLVTKNEEKTKTNVEDSPLTQQQHVDRHAHCAQHVHCTHVMRVGVCVREKKL